MLRLLEEGTVSVVIAHAKGYDETHPVPYAIKTAGEADRLVFNAHCTHNLARYLLAKGQRVVTLDIAPFDYADVRDKIRVVDGDIRKPDNVRDSLRDVDIVVHAAAALPLYKPEDIYSTDIEGTRIVFEESMRAGVKRVGLSVKQASG